MTFDKSQRFSSVQVQTREQSKLIISLNVSLDLCGTGDRREEQDTQVVRSEQ